MYHHYNSQFFATGWANRSGECIGAFKPHKIVAQAADKAFYQASLTCFEIAKKLISALAIDIHYLTGTQSTPLFMQQLSL
jgi:hypothetical protein